MSVNIKKDFGGNRTRKPDLTTMGYGKIPPQAPELESAVLGAIILESASFYEVMAILPTHEVFYMEAHQEIYKALLEMHEANKPIDTLTLKSHLEKKGKLEIIGGTYYLVQLTNSVLSSAHVDSHARIIYEKWILRESIRISGTTLSMAYDNETDCFELVETAQNLLSDLVNINHAKATVHIADAASEAITKLIAQRDSPYTLTGITTGYHDMNDAMYGFQDTDLTIIAARPGVGKTSFALNLAFNAANKPHWVLENGTWVEKKVCVCFFSMEMGTLQIVYRAFGFIGKVSLTRLNKPKALDDNDLNRLIDAKNRMRDMGVHIDDTAGMNMAQARAKARKLKLKNPDVKWMWIFDYLQLIEPSNPTAIREQQIAKISRDLKKMAGELGDPVIALSQLNRTTDEFTIPQLKDLRESGAIEQDANNVLFLCKADPKEYSPDAILVIGAKFRNGKVFRTPFYFRREYQLFTEQESETNTEPPPNPQAGMRKELPKSKMFVPEGFQNFYEPVKDKDEDLPF